MPGTEEDLQRAGEAIAYATHGTPKYVQYLLERAAEAVQLASRSRRLSRRLSVKREALPRMAEELRLIAAGITPGLTDYGVRHDVLQKARGLDWLSVELPATSPAQKPLTVGPGTEAWNDFASKATGPEVQAMQARLGELIRPLMKGDSLKDEILFTRWYERFGGPIDVPSRHRCCKDGPYN